MYRTNARKPPPEVHSVPDVNLDRYEEKLRKSSERNRRFTGWSSTWWSFMWTVMPIVVIAFISLVLIIFMRGKYDECNKRGGIMMDGECVKAERIPLQ